LRGRRSAVFIIKFQPRQQRTQTAGTDLLAKE
jgi:hypothetical protein